MYKNAVSLYLCISISVEISVTKTVFGYTAVQDISSTNQRSLLAPLQLFTGYSALVFSTHTRGYLPRASSKVPTFDAKSSSCTRIFEFVVNDSSCYRHGMACMDVLSRSCTRKNDVKVNNTCYSFYHFCPAPALSVRIRLCAGLSCSSEALVVRINFLNVSTRLA